MRRVLASSGRQGLHSLGLELALPPQKGSGKAPYVHLLNLPLLSYVPCSTDLNGCRCHLPDEFPCLQPGLVYAVPESGEHRVDLLAVLLDVLLAGPDQAVDATPILRPHCCKPFILNLLECGVNGPRTGSPGTLASGRDLLHDLIAMHRRLRKQAQDHGTDFPARLAAARATPKAERATARPSRESMKSSGRRSPAPLCPGRHRGNPGSAAKKCAAGLNGQPQRVPDRPGPNIHSERMSAPP